MNKKYYFDKNDINNLSDIGDKVDILFKWIDENILPRKNAMRSMTSYGLKHIMERDIGLYVSNTSFKEAMLIKGYEPVNPGELNWFFCISKKSPCMIKRHRELINK